MVYLRLLVVAVAHKGNNIKAQVLCNIIHFHVVISRMPQTSHLIERHGIFGKRNIISASRLHFNKYNGGFVSSFTNQINITQTATVTPIAFKNNVAFTPKKRFDILLTSFSQIVMLGHADTLLYIQK